MKLKKIADFPYISYLEADELRAEVDRLRGMNLAYPRDEEVERERRLYLQLLEPSLRKKRSRRLRLLIAPRNYGTLPDGTEASLRLGLCGA